MNSKHHLAWVIASMFLMLAANGQVQDHATRHGAGDGTQVTVTSRQPAPNHYVLQPAFEQLDAYRAGYNSRAEAYAPLFNDFDLLAHHAERVSARQLKNWVLAQTR